MKDGARTRLEQIKSYIIGLMTFPQTKMSLMDAMRKIRIEIERTLLDMEENKDS